jgi:hypothetical protein
MVEAGRGEAGDDISNKLLVVLQLEWRRCVVLALPAGCGSKEERRVSVACVSWLYS